VVSYDQLFGGEELSARSPVIQARMGEPTLVLNPADACAWPCAGRAGGLLLGWQPLAAASAPERALAPGLAGSATRGERSADRPAPALIDNLAGGHRMSDSLIDLLLEVGKALIVLVGIVGLAPS
jgi:NADH-quinone oxidoreductase subunit G